MNEYPLADLDSLGAWLRSDPHRHARLKWALVLFGAAFFTAWPLFHSLPLLRVLGLGLVMSARLLEHVCEACKAENHLACQIHGCHCSCFGRAHPADPMP